jgi:AraC-like DNA-binding protein
MGGRAQPSLVCLGAGEHVGPVNGFHDRELGSHGLVVVSEGHGSYTDADRTLVPVDSPALIWLFPGVKHGYGPNSAGWSEHWLLFSGSGAAIYEELGLVDRTHPVVTLNHAPARLAYLFRLLRHDLVKAGPRAQLRSSVLATDLLEAAIAETPASDSTADSAGIMQKLESTALDRGSIAERALRCGVSVSELRSVVRDAAGTSPLEFLIEIKMSRARSLLADSRLDVQGVARAVGYDDPAYFSRIFTSRSGVSPSAFRLQQYRSASSLEHGDGRVR